MSTSSTSIKLSRETIIQLQSLSLPGEPLDSVIQRAVLALHTLEARSPIPAQGEDAGVTRRLDALESRVDRIERRWGAYPDAKDQDDDP